MHVRSVRLVAGLVMAAAVAAAADRFTVEAILLRVNDRILTVSDFRKRVELELSQQRLPLAPDQLRGFAEGLFESIVEETILLERAHQKRLTVDDEMLDRAIQTLREDNNLLDEEAFEAALASTGLTEAGLRERYRENMLLSRAAQSEIQPTQITEEEVRRRYERDKERFQTPDSVELEQVFFPLAEDESNRAEVERIVVGMLERVQAGADLRAEATLAGARLDELGEIPTASLHAELQAELEGMEPGAVSRPLVRPGGLLVVHLVRRIPSGYQPYDVVREEVRRQISQEAMAAQTRGMVERLRKEYLVEENRELLDTALIGLTVG